MCAVRYASRNSLWKSMFTKMGSIYLICKRCHWHLDNKNGTLHQQNYYG